MTPGRGRRTYGDAPEGGGTFGAWSDCTSRRRRRFVSPVQAHRHVGSGNVQLHGRLRQQNARRHPATARPHGTSEAVGRIASSSIRSNWRPLQGLFRTQGVRSTFDGCEERRAVLPRPPGDLLRDARWRRPNRTREACLDTGRGADRGAPPATGAAATPSNGVRDGERRRRAGSPQHQRRICRTGGRSSTRNGLPATRRRGRGCRTRRAAGRVMVVARDDET